MSILGIDLGTSSIKALILDRQGHTLSVGKADYQVMSPKPGWVEGHPGGWWRAMVAAVRAAIAQAPQAEIYAIGLAGQMHGVVLVDEQGQPLRHALLWPDTRAGAELERYRKLPCEVLQRLANPLVPGMAGPLLCWLARHEAASYGAVRWVLQPKDWLRLTLTGSVSSDPSDASATLLYDLPADRWADDIIAALGLRRELFPTILPSGALAGMLSERAATVLGLPPGLPVATGAADTAAAALGIGLLDPGPIQLTLGTGAQLIQLCPEPIADPTLRTHLYRAADGVNWYRIAAVQNAGLALDWVRRTLSATWEDLYASAETVAFGIRSALEALPGASTESAQSAQSAIRLAGGGSLHPAWRQMLADILGRGLLVIDVPDASARGVALLGGIASGVWANAMETRPLAPEVSVLVAPNTERVRVYDEVYARWNENIRKVMANDEIEHDAQS